MLELIPAIVTRFRLVRVGTVADIAKAFQQITVGPNDRGFLRFLWWEDNSCRRLQVFRHTRVVFGVSSSPYLLPATLEHHLRRMQNEDNYHSVELLLSGMYVDNTVISVPDKAGATELKNQAQQLLLTAKFDLRGWEIGPGTENKEIPVLGRIWNLKTNMLKLDIGDLLKRCEDSEPTQ